MTFDELREQAMKLSDEEREALANELLGSLSYHLPGDGCTQEEWEAAWGEEIRRRLERFDRGESVARDCKEAMAELRARRKAKKAGP
jgi:hypothetical protein